MSKRRRVIIGVGAGIAAYKATNVVRALSKSGFEVWVIPTPAALEMVGALTWQALSGNPVYSQVNEPGTGVGHIELARDADLIAVVPATANVLARIAHGLANDMLTNVVLAADCPLLLAPAMHTNMWNNPATQENVKLLKGRGIHFIGPDRGELSSGDVGIGRLVSEDCIVEQILSLLSPKAWQGKNVLVSAGGTREPLDPVRFLGNRSSGIFGVQIARQFGLQGANVTLLAANIEPQVLAALPRSVKILSTPTATEMYNAAAQYLPDMQVVVMAAAVADYQPAQFQTQKIKKTPEKGEFFLNLRPTVDILAYLAEHKQPGQIVTGFAAETGSWKTVIDLGKEKARRKGADILFINKVGQTAGFGDTATQVSAVDNLGNEIGQFRGEKPEIAPQIVSLIGQHCQ